MLGRHLTARSLTLFSPSSLSSSIPQVQPRQRHLLASVAARKDRKHKRPHLATTTQPTLAPVFEELGCWPERMEQLSATSASHTHSPPPSPMAVEETMRREENVAGDYRPHGGWVEEEDSGAYRRQIAALARMPQSLGHPCYSTQISQSFGVGEWEIEEELDHARLASWNEEL